MSGPYKNTEYGILQYGIPNMAYNRIPFTRVYHGDIIYYREYLIYNIKTKKWSVDTVCEKDKKEFFQSNLVYGLPEVIE